MYPLAFPLHLWLLSYLLLQFLHAITATELLFERGKP